MDEMKKIRYQLLLDYIMIPVSVFMAVNYLLIVLNGDDSTIRIIALCVWTFGSLVWPVKLFADLKKKKALINSQL